MKYTVTAKSCENPNITAQYKGLCEDCAFEVVKILGVAFRSVEVLNEETGEVEFTHYVSDNWFSPSMTYGGALDDVVDVVYSCGLFEGGEDEGEDEDSQLHFAIDF